MLGRVDVESPDVFVSGQKWMFLRHPSAGWGVISSLRGRKCVLCTFDGVSSWQVIGYFPDLSQPGLLFELRRHSAVGFVTTDSLLFKYNLNFMHDPDLRTEAERLIRDLETWIAQERWDPVFMSAGVACDRLLLDALLAKQAAGNHLRPPNNGEPDPRKWDLSHRIQEAHRLGVINKDSIQHLQLEVARAFTNLRHAGAAQARVISPSPFDAAGCYAALKNLIEWLSH
ncbi:MAG: hypothetical protein HY650_00375 [Acidobacteria bacterium]|nr:hypothetical protein [Acidobacteriota bacterium]